MRQGNQVIHLLLASSTLVLGQVPSTPAAVYNGTVASDADPILIRVATGGAGQSGMLGGKCDEMATKSSHNCHVLTTLALADAFIKESVDNGTDPFRIAWYTTDTFYSIQAIGQGLADAAITYSEVAEQIAIDQGQAIDPSYYLWRDHFLLVGPTSNPANLSKEDDVQAQFTDLLIAAQNATRAEPTRFLSRYDKSATNVKESQQWISIGQTPWATAYSTWYHQYIGFPIQALTAAIKLGEYTVTDRGTFLSLDTELTDQIDIYKAATDELCDPLLNPAHMLVSTQAQNAEQTTAFAEWITSQNGQNVILGFEKNGEVLYSAAPSQQELDTFETDGCSTTAQKLRKRRLAR